jgi:DNA repair exonuclease SbcCD nuclease subunit
MSVRFIHSADWQLGAHFTQFGEDVKRLRSARLETLRRTLDLVAEREVDALLVAGDLFEDSQVDDRLVKEVANLLSGQSTPVFVLPGNHDPASGPGSIWQREFWKALPDHIRTFEEAGCAPLGDGWLLASPLFQKRSTNDPSQKIEALLSEIPSDAVKVGMTHGSLAIPSQHQPDDHPIDPKAATQLGLDYLALGHWHSWREEDGGRMLLPGTPEQDKWDTRDCGWVALVEIDGPGQSPRVTREPVATLNWNSLELNCAQPDAEMDRLTEELAELEPQKDTTILRVQLKGELGLEDDARVREWLAKVTGGFPIVQQQDQSIARLTAGEREALLAEHPMLARVWVALESMEVLAGKGLSVGEGGLSNAEMQLLIKEAGLDSADETKLGVHLQEARRLFMKTLREGTQ